MSSLIKGPWDEWIPGVLHRSQINELYSNGLIVTDARGLDVGACSIDLLLSAEGYRLTQGSVKPSSDYLYHSILTDTALAEKVHPEDDRSFLLEARQTYVFRLSERLSPALARLGIFGQATAKSSVGRVDVLARLIVDGMNKYECFGTDLNDKTGNMYIEITPITFSVKVMPGTALSQLRLFYGRPEDTEIEGQGLFKTLLGGEATDGTLTVDLKDEMINGVNAAAFCARQSAGGAIPLWKGSETKPDPCKYWRLVPADSTRRLQIRDSEFYILRSKERLFVPRGIAIYCKASDETIGEMRIHYAGFAHPFFGTARQDKKRGTPLIFEVRGHQVNANLIDGEKLANLTCYRMSRDCNDDDKETSYNEQELELSKFFNSWPSKLKMNGDGTVETAI
jgi:dCTP deaminase